MSDQGKQQRLWARWLPAVSCGQAQTEEGAQLTVPNLAGVIGFMGFFAACFTGIRVGQRYDILPRTEQVRTQDDDDDECKITQSLLHLQEQLARWTVRAAQKADRDGARGKGQPVKGVLPEGVSRIYLDEIFEETANQLFPRYDFDLSGSLNSHTEFQQLSFNTAAKLSHELNFRIDARKIDGK